MIKYTLFFSFFAIASITSYAQNANDIKLPTILPASPEASAINKGAALSVGMFTGAANASIPLGEIKMSGITLPISLNYSGNGLKVDEIPGRTGLGWNLSTAGVVSRIVHGLPDDNSTRLNIPATFPSMDASTLEIFKKKVNNPTIYDSEPDEFRADAPGLSIKFILDDNEMPVIVPHGNEKIEVLKGGGNSGGDFKAFIITNTDGVQYKFGAVDFNGNNAIEVTQTRTNTGGVSMPQRIRTAFYLTQIKLVNGDKINFFYAQITTTNILGVTCSLNHSVGTTSNSTNTVCGQICPTNTNAYSEVKNAATYETVYLSRIETSNYQKLILTYENRPDNFGDNRIKKIVISNPGYSKAYHLNYEDPLCGNYAGYNLGLVNKRFFLKDVTTYLEINNNDENGEPTIPLYDTLKFSIDYFDNMALPQRLSYTQDHLGFNNGQNNNNLLPQKYVYPATQYATANREYKGAEAVKGMLKKITMPTGGYEEFEYEPNKNSRYELVNTVTTNNVTGQGNTINGMPINVTYYSPNFNILRPQTVNIYYNLSHLEECGSANPADCAPFVDNTTVFATMQIYNGNTLVHNSVRKSYGVITFSLPLTVGNYYIKLIIKGRANLGLVTLTYDYAASNQYAWSDYEIGGVRVKKVTTYEPVTSKFTYKYYKYNKLNAPGRNLASSMVGPNYKTVIHTRSVCDATSFIINSISECSFENYVSSSSPLVYTYNGSHVAYPFVIESDDPNYLNGGVQNNFAADAFVEWLSLLGATQQYLPSNTTTTLMGVALGSKVFNSNLQILKEQKNYYHVDNIVDKVVNATTFDIMYNIGYLESSTPYWPNIYDMFNVSRYIHQSNWIQKDSTITIDYDIINNTSFKTIQFYGYGTPDNVQPKTTESINSKGQTIKQILKYPTDFPTTQPYIKMKNRNILNPVIETESFTNNISTGKIRNEFFDWYPGSIYEPLIIAPKKIWAKRGMTPEECRIQYSAYDIKGHPLEVSKEGGAKVSYLWGYNNDFPIAEVKNASILTDSIAYTSFETIEKGNWLFNGNKVAGATSPPTGMFYYDLNNGAISRTINFAKNYLLTYWLKDGSGTVSVNSASSKILISRNGWTCYEHKITNNSIALINITGSGSIDELRLYPEGSFMTTMTHRPFVGITSRNEANNQIVYYDYDANARLIRIRDMDRNIVKQMEYQYKKQIAPCANTTANWVPTGDTKCEQAGVNNNFTGLRVQEEIDRNNCSPTYLNKQWTSLGSFGGCVPLPACNGADKRVIVTSGIATCETGSKILLSSIKIGPNFWQCTFHYVWTDGFISPDFIESGTSNCSITILEY